jgi:hypothetical protein
MSGRAIVLAVGFAGRGGRCSSVLSGAQGVALLPIDALRYE